MILVSLLCVGYLVTVLVWFLTRPGGGKKHPGPPQAQFGPDYWEILDAGAYKPKKISAYRMRELNPETVRVAVDEAAGTLAADVIMGFIWLNSRRVQYIQFLEEQLEKQAQQGQPEAEAPQMTTNHEL